MANQVTSADYIRVRDQHTQILERLAAVAATVDSLSREVRSGLLELRTIYLSHRAMTADVRQKMDHVIRQLVILNRISPLAYEANALISAYKTPVMTDIETSGALESSLRWTFMSASGKTKAIEAYDRLASALGGTYPASAQRIENEVSKLYEISAEEAYRTIDTDRSGYAALIGRFLPAGFHEAEPYLGRRFDDSEISGLLSRYEKIGEMIRSVKTQCENAEKQLIVKANALVMSRALNDTVDRELHTGRFGEGSDPQVTSFLGAICFYLYSGGMRDTAQELSEFYNRKIKDAMNALQKGSVGLGWIFGSQKDKVSADEAYRYLTGLSDSDYIRAVYDAADKLNRISDPQSADVLADFRKDVSRYRDAVSTAAPFAFTSSKLMECIRSVIAGVADTKTRFSACGQVTEQSRAEILSAVLRCRHDELIKLLSEIPVEELNRNKAGFKVKLLRDAGLATVADVYAASSAKLADIRGISTENAEEIKAAASDIASTTSRSLPIRLTADSRTQSTTELAEKLYGYIRRSESLKQARTIMMKQEAVIRMSENRLRSLGNGLSWLFFTPSEKQSCKASFDILDDYLNGETGSLLTKLYAAVRGDISVSVDAVWDDFSADPIAYHTVLEEICPGILGEESGDLGLPEDLAEQIAEEDISSDGLLCTLRPYQTLGVKYILHQKRVLLGDEMGLGKTVQAIAAMVSLKNSGKTHFLVVCPASVITNWCREVTKHSRLPVVEIHAQDKDKELSDWLTGGGVGITTYETTKIMQDADDFRFDMLIVDEAHYIKNRQAQRTQNVLSLCARTDRVLFMTGTALENKVDEMISLIGALDPQLASSLESMAFMSTAPQFREKIAPVYFRRKREDVLKELPDLVEIKEWCTLTDVEEQIYEDAVLSRNYANVRRVSWNVPNLQYSSKALRLKELVEEAKNENRKVIVFSFFLDTIDKVMSLFESSCVGPINGSVPAEKRQEMIDDFDKAPPGTVLAAQIQSGGTGLNIQSASVVIICEPQFKPSIENQAISRAYRMGQSRSVLVYRLLCDDTVDEKISSVLEYKQSLFDAFADESVSGREAIEIDQLGFGEIVQQEADRIIEKNKANADADTDTTA